MEQKVVGELRETFGLNNEADDLGVLAIDADA